MHTKHMPEDCALIQAKLVKEGDRVRFRTPAYDYTVESVEVNNVGNFVHHFDNGMAYSCYQPEELLWITRRG